MNPEKEVEIKLWDWLKTKSTFIKEIYFNSKNEINAPIFKTEKSQKKPDFIVKINRGYGIEFIAIEIKNASSSRSVLDAGKILDYYEDYFLGKIEYFINDKKININHFIVATQNSINGYLFNSEKNVIENIGSNDKWRDINAKYGLEPKFEYSETSRFQRHLWNNFNRLRKKLNIKNGASIGILQSDFYLEKVPYIFIMNYNSNLKKAKWGARFWKI